MKLKIFQKLTVKQALQTLRAKRGAKRFLVADEVGLGKTRIAQHVIDGLCESGKHLRVFYVCSSLSIIHQNRDALLDILPENLRNKARVDVDRLTLIPITKPTQEAPFTLYTLTPGTLPGGRRTGRADERAVIWRILCEVFSGLSGHRSVEAVFRRDVKWWDYHTAQADGAFDSALCHEFRRRISRELGLADAPWTSTAIAAIKKVIEDGQDKELIAKCRLALSEAALERLAPDLVIFDEFQRFFELLVPDDDEDPVARKIIDHLLSGHSGHNPAVLLLSATPYRLYSGWNDGAYEHHEKFFRLLEFLFGEQETEAVIALRKDFKEYRVRLQADVPGSREVFHVRDRIVERLSKVIARTERPQPFVSARDLPFECEPAPLQPLDVRLFKHLRDSALKADRAAVPAYWSSIPLPLQMMDKGYVLVERATPAPLQGDGRKAILSWKHVRRFAPAEHPHPKLRALLGRIPAEALSLPWIPPSLPWWPLAGLFSAGQTRNASKALVFSRFRAVPRAVSAMLSYEAERHCFSIQNQRKRKVRPVAYEYRTAKGTQPPAGFRRRPRASFTFPMGTRRDTAIRNLLMFMPAPELARLGDPLSLSKNGEPLTFDRAVFLVAQRIQEKLNLSIGRSDSTSAAEIVTALERNARTLEAVERGVQRWLEHTDTIDDSDGENQSRGIREATRTFFAINAAPRSVSERELRELAEIALLAPGNVLCRAVTRVFGVRIDPDQQSHRYAALTNTAFNGLRNYLDLPDFHLLFRSKKHNQHPAAVRRAIWDGNLESVLDEHLATASGLGEHNCEIEMEEKILDSLTHALTVGAAAVSVRDGIGGSDDFRMRCHAALPFGLGAQEKENQSGELRSDSLRVSFNSPFRPHVLTTTSVGQEGLDFHVWADQIVHWDLPANPVDLEQRDGRLNRYGSLAVRRALAANHVDITGDGSPWRALAESQQETYDGLGPWWVNEGAKIKRIVPVPPFSRMSRDLQLLRNALSLYRLTLGQADQEALIDVLQRRASGAGEDGDAVLQWFHEARIDLSPANVSQVRTVEAHV